MKRKEILPKWIRFFSWIFLFFAFSPLLLIAGLFIPGNYSFDAFGLSYNGTYTLNPLAFYITGIQTLASIVSYGILWGKNWAITLGIGYSFIALATAIYVILSSFNSVTTYIPLEPVFLIPFLVILVKKKQQWSDFEDGAAKANRVEAVDADWFKEI